MQRSLASLKSVVANHSVVRHPFLERFRAGRFSKAQVALWCEQQFYFSISLPSAFAALYARIPDKHWKAKRPLVDLMKVEAWGTDGAECHSNHFVAFSAFLGIDLIDLQNKLPKFYTRDYVSTRLDFCLNPDRPVTQGLAVIGLGNEALNLRIFQAYREGIPKMPEFKECPTGYFDAHLSDEESDFRIFEHLFDRMDQTDGAFEEARVALLQLLWARHKFFNHLLKDLEKLD